MADQKKRRLSQKLRVQNNASVSILRHEPRGRLPGPTLQEQLMALTTGPEFRALPAKADTHRTYIISGNQRAVQKQVRINPIYRNTGEQEHQ